jgi:lipopolysaccharide export system protein LptA
MYANNKTHTATFTDNVEVVNVPSEDPNADPNIDKLPEGGFYLRCDRLEVYSPQTEGKSSNEMLAKGHIQFRAQDYYGLSDTVTYNEGKDQVILEGVPARVFRIKSRADQDEMRARKIIYLRRTGEFHMIQGGGFQGSQSSQQAPPAESTTPRQNPNRP